MSARGPTITIPGSLPVIGSTRLVPRGYVDHDQRPSVLEWLAPAVLRMLVVAGPAFSAFCIRIISGPHPVDDAFITFRYARNLAEGAGLIYNPGSWVLGTTTPAWAVALAGAYRLGATNLPLDASLLSAAADAASVVLIGMLLRSSGLTGGLAALVGFAWALNPMSIAYAAGGMETSLFICLLVAVLVLLTRDQPQPAALLAGLGCFVRPESALLAAIALGTCLLRKRTQAPAAAVLATAPVVLGGALLWHAYGSPIPQSLVAKQFVYQGQTWWQTPAAFALQAVLPGWSTVGLAQLPDWLLAAFTLLAVAGWVRGLALFRRRDHAAVPLAFGLIAAVTAAYVAFYTAGALRGARLFPWYLVPLAMLYMLLLTSTASGARPRRQLLCGLLIVLWQLPTLDAQHLFLPSGWDLRREAAYSDIGRDLASRWPADTVVAGPEIGALGYVSNLPILDTVGLVSPQALPYYPVPAADLVSDNAVPPRLIDDRQPSVVVSLDEFVRQSLLTDPAFIADYRLVRAYPLSVWQSQSVLVFARRDTPLSAGP